MGESDRFAASQLRADQRAWLAGFPDTLMVAGDVLMCHGTPASDLDYLLDTVDETGCRPALRAEVEQRALGCSASLIVCAHTHLPRTMRLTDGRTVLNPGSVGLQAYPAKWPFSHTMEAGSPHARYAVADRTDQDWRVEFIEVVYDWESAARRAEANGRADWAVGLRTGRV
jgi:predicted phosphodiesterase